MTTPVVAFLGTGVMGAGMIRSLRRTELAVRAWNRDRERAEPLRESGATIADSPAEAVAGADVVVTMLFDADAVVDVIRRAAPPRGTPWLQMSTVGIDGAASTAEVAGELGLVLVDAPVLGTRQPAEEGTLVVLASGPEEARAQAAPVFDAVGGRTLWVGEAGMGSRLKLVCNGWVLGLTAALGQSVAMSEALGLDPQSFLDAIAGGASDMPYAHVKGAAMMKHEYPVAFGLLGARKDAALIREALRAAGVPDALDSVVLDLLDTAADRLPDPGSADISAVVEALRPRG
jgi:3-hydroxyisobutyrate dehydrogenase